MSGSSYALGCIICFYVRSSNVDAAPACQDDLEQDQDRLGFDGRESDLPACRRERRIDGASLSAAQIFSQLRRHRSSGTTGTVLEPSQS